MFECQTHCMHGHCLLVYSVTVWSDDGLGWRRQAQVNFWSAIPDWSWQSRKHDGGWSLSMNLLLTSTSWRIRRSRLIATHSLLKPSIGFIPWKCYNYLNDVTTITGLRWKYWRFLASSFTRIYSRRIYHLTALKSDIYYYCMASDGDEITFSFTAFSGGMMTDLNFAAKRCLLESKIRGRL